jgi:hypothetical protein
MKEIKQHIIHELEQIDNDAKTHGHSYNWDLRLVKELCKTLYYVEEACEIMEEHKNPHREHKMMDKQEHPSNMNNPTMNPAKY